MEYGTSFLLGLVGSLHCAGMCGPLAVAVSAAAMRSRSINVVTSESDFAIPVMNRTSMAPPKSGVGSMSSAEKEATSSTPSTITP
jgi:hypothetical protein